MSDIVKVLKEVRGGEPVCVYRTVGDPEKFRFGRILAVNGDYTALYEIAPNGAYDGVGVIPTDSISRIECGGQYAEKMSKLTASENYGQFPHALGDEDIRRQVVEIAVKERKIISLEILESGFFDVTGIVESVDDGVVGVLRVDEYGYEDGNTHLLLGDITQIAYCSDDEQIIGRLWEINRQ